MKGKVALVTGSSKGIGKAIAIEFADNGAKVVVNYSRSEKEAIEVVEGIKKKGGEAIAIKADISKIAEVEKMFEIIKEKFGKLDVLINNAGITRDRTLKNMSLDEWNDVITTNLNGAFYCTKLAIPIMGDGSSIVNMSSVVGLSGNFGQANYSAAKAGLIGFTKSLAKELGKRNIRVNAIAPGFIETEMTKEIPFIRKKIIVSMIPLGKMGMPEDIAKVAYFLCSDKAGYITGEVIRVDGGLSF